MAFIPLTSPQHFGTYARTEIPTWPFTISLIAFPILLFMNLQYHWDWYWVFPLGILIFMLKFFWYDLTNGLLDATEAPPPLPLTGEANVRASFHRRTATRRDFFWFTHQKTELVVFITLSELALTRLKAANYWSGVWYTYTFTPTIKEFTDTGTYHYHFSLEDLVTKGPFVFGDRDISQINKVENELREKVKEIGETVKILTDERALHSSDTVEF